MRACPTCRCAASMLDASSSPGVASCASLRQRRASVASLTCTPTSCVRVGADPALGPRLHEVGPRSATATRLGAGAPSRQARRLPDLPAVLRQRLQSIPPPFSEGGESPSAVTGACHFVCMPRRTASVRCCAAASRPSPSGGLVASLDAAAHYRSCWPLSALISRAQSFHPIRLRHQYSTNRLLR